jgi:DNA-binding GntR family transcriptional regulator
MEEAVYDQLFKSILSGRMSPGERITLYRIAKELNVSMMPVREALRRLEAGNFVTIERNKRIVVKEHSVENLKEILRIRLVLESYAAKEASQTRSEKLINRLEKVFEALSHAKNDRAFLEANKEFHIAMYQGANMPILMEIIKGLWERASPYFHIALRNEKNWDRRALIEVHKAMLDGMRCGDTKKICNCLKNDMTRATNLIVQAFEPDRK